MVVAKYTFLLFLLFGLGGCLPLHGHISACTSLHNDMDIEIHVRSASLHDTSWQLMKPDTDMVLEGWHDIEIKIKAKVYRYSLFSRASESLYEPQGSYAPNKGGCFFFVLGKDSRIYTRRISVSTWKPIPVRFWSEIEKHQPDGYPLNSDL